MSSPSPVQRTYGPGVIQEADERLSSQAAASNGQLLPLVLAEPNHMQAAKDELNDSERKIADLRLEQLFSDDPDLLAKEYELLLKKAVLGPRLLGVQKKQNQRDFKARKRQAALEKARQTSAAGRCLQAQVGRQGNLAVPRLRSPEELAIM